MAQKDGTALATKARFARSCSVSITIAADAARVWTLLTDAVQFPLWNSTVTKVEGPIAPGQKLRITVPISQRAFTPSVTQFDPPSSMTWSDGKAPIFRGIRHFSITPLGNGSVTFTMTETFTGAMLPVIARTLPDFVPIFERYAADLKRAAESTAIGDTR